MTQPARPTVLHIITGLGTGGAERMLAQIVSRGDQFVHEVIVLADRGPVGAQLAAEGHRVTAMGAATRLNGILAIPRIWREVRRRAPDAVQSWLVHANLVSAVVTPRRVKLLWSVRHSLDGFHRENRLTRFAVALGAKLARRPQSIIYNSGVAADHHEAIGYPRDRRMVIPNGFALVTDDVVSESRTRTRAALGVRDRDVLVGMVGRVHPIKNHEGFLDACTMLAGSYPAMRIVLIGKGTEPEGALAQRYSHRLDGKVLWLGERSDVLALTSALDIACNTSYGEAFSNVVGEAMSYGVPCVVTDVGESAALLGDSGWVVPSPDPKDIELSLQQALSMSPEGRRQLGARARQRIAKHFSIEAIVRQYEDHYASMFVQSAK